MNSSSTDATIQATTGSELSVASRQITSGTTINMHGTQKSLDNPLYAINWFDAQPAWLYHLYNYVASSRLTKIGGRPLFKGKTKATLSGDEALRREFLLIVNYPSANHFLNLMSDKPFLLFSVLRMMSVRRFSFVMHDAVEPTELGADMHYTVVHFDSDNPNDHRERLMRLAEEYGVKPAFVGEKRVVVSSSNKEGEKSPMSFVTPNTVVLAAETDSQLIDALGRDQFREWAASVKQHYAAIVERTY